MILWMHGDATGFGLAFCGMTVPVNVDAAIRILLTASLRCLGVIFVISRYSKHKAELGKHASKRNTHGRTAAL